jgi:predicted AAA+ superfamily ATPase
LYDENSFTLKSLYKEVASKDLDRLQEIGTVDSKFLKESMKKVLGEELKTFSDIIDELPDFEGEYTGRYYGDDILKKELLELKCWSEGINKIEKYHKKWGVGIFAEYRAFVWESFSGKGKLKGVEKPDNIRLKDLIGYEMERSMVLENTIQFVKGYPANNVLIYGDRGTGKSSTVKAILNEYYEDGLRMIELPKANLKDFPSVIRELKYRAQRFIIFVDDLAFEDNEESYTALKAILEGGLESKTSNIIVYATSNRRHLVKEYFSDRKGLLSKNADDEVRAHDSIEEKMSLSDRFGVSVIFSAPDQEKYLEIVQGLADKRNIKIDKETLKKEAIKWELWYNGRSARTARQFVDWMEGSQGIK